MHYNVIGELIISPFFFFHFYYLWFISKLLWIEFVLFMMCLLGLYIVNMEMCLNFPYFYVISICV